MKIKNIFITLGVCAAMVLGAGASLRTNKVIKAKADNETTFYLDCTGFDGWDNAQSVCLHAYKSDGNVNDWIEATKAGDNYWSVSKDVTGYTGVEWYRCDSGNTGNHYNKQSWLAFPSSNFYYEVKGWDDPGDNKQWSAPAAWSLTGSSSASLSSHKFDADGYQFYATSISLATNAVIQFTNGTKTTGFADLRDVGNGQTAKEKGLVVDDGTGKVKVVKGGSYDIYVNCITGKVWMQSDAATDADHWAEAFLNDGCTTANTGTKAKWEDHKTSFDALTEGAKNLLKNEEHVEHDVVVSGNVKLAVQRYDYVLQRYGVNDANADANGYKDFMGRVSSGKLTLSAITIPYSIVENNASNTAIIIVVVSTISLLGLAGFFFIKRKKESK